MTESSVVPLQSKDHKALLDIIDKLRSRGINHYVDLPQIVVCGDQSSGKSSVLQAISRFSFPTKDNLCTRFATELVLRHTDKGSEEKCSVSIHPGSDRSPEERNRLESFLHSEIPEQRNIGLLVDKAKDFMGLNGDQSKTFSNDVLRIELSGPDQPHLTIVDLPGLFRAGNREQSSEDAAVVRSLVRSYMKNRRSIILAVVSAKNDFALQEVTRYAREIDPQGQRTMGLITKPDALDVGSDSERAYVELAQNRDVKFRLGWHVVRNRDFYSRDATNEARDQAEAEFLSRGVWADIPRNHKGAASLQVRLSDVLKDLILDQLHVVMEDIENGIKDCSNRLEKVGTARGTVEEQRKYLLHTSHLFSSLLQAAVDGVYRDNFFGNAREGEGYRKRLRAVVQNTLTDFSECMRKRGQARRIVVDDAEEADEHTTPNTIRRQHYLMEVKELMRRTRGCELPGTYNPLIIGDLFHEQCQPWKKWIEEYSGRIMKEVDYSITAVLAHVVDEITGAELWAELLSPGLDKLKEKFHVKVAEILAPHESGHPITYNHYMVNNFQTALARHRRDDIERRLRASSQVNSDNGRVFGSLETILDAVARDTEADMETFACSTATDMMEAYYKVALKNVVDNFARLAVEACLVAKIPSLFTPDIVFGLSDEDVQRIATENEDIVFERTTLTEKLEVLTDSLRDLKLFSRHHQTAPTTYAPSASERLSSRSSSRETKYSRSRSSSERSSYPVPVEICCEEAGVEIYSPPAPRVASFR
ncbi:P-loop containing nucleoside triphosphate hydrolase protein [Pseudomassariella vexata]|uniref:p-loop containing nucleoside triphosphate hydrolase protein n=1 Tax=Pseudomassariella vexata TaxID=1141098 RepID=A0A1Y2DDZ6_9PEZI|nr:P-loop containing nucleoside triphosphate hydrolase protein [Pseudomassariella vexata]ORY57502.1 P-loop containing nucleoside triphosphate hydrolase protein [Pseudomassariella vexata]